MSTTHASGKFIRPAPHSAPTMNSNANPRQKGHDHHAGFHKHDQEQQRVHPHAVALHERLQVFVYVQNEIDQKGHYFHERALRGWGEEVESSAHYPHHPAIKSPWGRRLKSDG